VRCQVILAPRRLSFPLFPHPRVALPGLSSPLPLFPYRKSLAIQQKLADADCAVAEFLAEAVNAGWAHPSELKEPDFDALRGREDFKKLLAEVEARKKAKAAKKEAESE
jgi:hypothetical protein